MRGDIEDRKWWTLQDKYFVLPIFLFVLLLIVGVLNTRESKQTSVSDEAYPKTISNEDVLNNLSVGDEKTIPTKEILGLWRKEAANSKQPYLIEIQEGKVCSSWSGISVSDFQCIAYTPYEARTDGLYMMGGRWITWEEKDGEFILYDANDAIPFRKVESTSSPIELARGEERSSIKELSSGQPQSQKPALTPPPAPPSISKPWRTYEDLEYGFRIQHPGEFIVKRIENASQYQNRPYRMHVDGQGVFTMKQFDNVQSNTRGIYIAPSSGFLPSTYVYSELYASLPRSVEEFIFIGSYKDFTEADMVAYTNEVICVFDEHYSMKLNFSGNVEIGKGKYLAKKYAGDSCEFGKQTVKNVDMVEVYLIEDGGISHLIKLHHVNRSRIYPGAFSELSNAKRLSSILETFELRERTESHAESLTITSPVVGDVWTMKQRTYSIHWNPVDFEWHNGYDMSRSRGGRVLFTLISDDVGFTESPVTETDFDTGEYVWTIPYGGLTPLDRNVRFLMRVFPANVSVTTHNEYAVYSNPFLIRSLVTEYPPIEFLSPSGGEEIKIGSPFVISWNVLPEEVENIGLFVRRVDTTGPDSYLSGLLLPQKSVNGIYESIGWSKGMTNFTWDAKTLYIGLQKDTIQQIKPGKYMVGLWFVMPDKVYTQIESKEFSIISP